MSLIANTMSVGSSLLEHRRLTWTRSRPGASTEDPVTGYTVPGAPSTGTLTAFFSWLTEREKQDYAADAAAIVLTTPGELRPGDTITNATIGQFVVLDGGVKPQGDHDRVELRRSG